MRAQGEIGTSYPLAEEPGARAEKRTDDVAVAIVSYNTRDQLRGCLAAAAAERPGGIVVVDNDSSDGSADMVRRHFPDVTVCANRENRGYGAAANQAIAHTDSPFVLLLNADTRLSPGSLDALSHYLRHHPRVGAAGPRLCHPDGSLQPSTYAFPTPGRLIMQEAGLEPWLARVPVLRERNLRTWRHDRPRAVSWVLGAAMALRRDAFDAAGGFDEAFFLYFEEVDLCVRLAAAGWQIHFVPEARVVHVGGASTRQAGTRLNRLFFASAARFYRKHCSAGQLAKLRALVASIVLLRMARAAGSSIVSRGSDRSSAADQILVCRQVLIDALHGWPAAG